ncbi:MAG: hypothetical protein ABII12_00730 [Planctomycetota bacterium]
MTAGETRNSNLMPTELILNELDEFAARWDEMARAENGEDCKRSRHRRRFRTVCDLWFYEHGGRTIRKATAQTRNLSETGLGLLAKCAILAGVPVEVCIAPPGRPPTYLAGIVAFCRYAQSAYHEIGVVLKARQMAPVFAEDPARAASLVPWLREALRTLSHASRTGRVIKTQIA